MVVVVLPFRVTWYYVSNWHFSTENFRNSD